MLSVSKFWRSHWKGSRAYSDCWELVCLCWGQPNGSFKSGSELDLLTQVGSYLGSFSICDVDSSNSIQCYLRAVHMHLISILLCFSFADWHVGWIQKCRKELCLPKEPALQRVCSKLLWDLRLQHRTWELFWTLVSCVAARGAHLFNPVWDKWKKPTWKRCKERVRDGRGTSLNIWEKQTQECGPWH